MLKCNYLVAVDNAGGLFLFITDDNEIILHAYADFEYYPGTLMNALHDLEDNPEVCESWESDLLNLHGEDAWTYCRKNNMDIVKWNGLIYPQYMRGSALSEFSLNDKIIECERIYIHKIHVYMECDSMKYVSDSELLILYNDGKVVSTIGDIERKVIAMSKGGKTVYFRLSGGVFYEVI